METVCLYRGLRWINIISREREREKNDQIHQMNRTQAAIVHQIRWDVLASLMGIKLFLRQRRILSSTDSTGATLCTICHNRSIERHCIISPLCYPQTTQIPVLETKRRVIEAPPYSTTLESRPRITFPNGAHCRRGRRQRRRRRWMMMLMMMKENFDASENFI